MVLQGMLMYWTLILCVYNYALFFMDCAAVAQILYLFHSPAVQSFLNGVPASTLHVQKLIYQPGSVRKVCFLHLSTHFAHVYVLILFLYKQCRLLRSLST